MWQKEALQNHMVLSTLLQNRVVLSLLHHGCLILALFLSPQNLVVLSLSTCSRTSWSSYSLQNHVAPCFLQSRVAYSLYGCRA